MKSRIDGSKFDRVFSSRKDHGTLVAIVGFNGAGKTTQVSSLARQFRNLGREVIETRQPTDWYRNNSAVVEFQARGGSKEEARILCLLGAADRLRHVYEVINPALSRGATVLCERYIYHHLAAFIHRGLDFDFIATINSGIPKPDFAVYLDVPPEMLFERLTQRNRGPLRFEERSFERIMSIVKLYQEMSSYLIRVDGTKPPAAVTSTICDTILLGSGRREF